MVYYELSIIMSCVGRLAVKGKVRICSAAIHVPLYS